MRGGPAHVCRMTFGAWFAVVSAVIFGNALTFAWGYFFWRCWKNERVGKDSYEGIPLWCSVFCGMMPPLLAAFGVYLTTQ